MSIQNLANAIKAAVDKRVREEARARRGYISGGRFITGSKSYPAKQAVECNTTKSVWAQLSTSGDAVIVGS